MPVQIRKATQHMAMFSVDADAAQRMIDYSGLQVCRYRPGRAVVVLMLMHYVDGDLGQYLEYGTERDGQPAGVGRQRVAAPCSRPAPSSITCPSTRPSRLEAGRTIWGYPKVMADFTVREVAEFDFDVSIDGQFAVGMDFRPGLPVPSAFTSKPQVHPDLLHTRRRHPRNRRGDDAIPASAIGPAACAVRLGDHPYAKELASLGFPKRAMISSSADNVEMTFGDAKEIA